VRLRVLKFAQQVFVARIQQVGGNIYTFPGYEEMGDSMNQSLPQKKQTDVGFILFGELRSSSLASL
jgi:hypothetical protein